MAPVTRFFRTYSRTLVLIIMSLLLVIFLIGDTLTGRRGRTHGDAGDLERQVGSAIGGPVTFGDLQRADHDAVVFAAFTGQDILRQIQGRDEGEKAIAYALLGREAEANGIRVGQAQIQDMLSRNPDSNQKFQALSTKYHMSQEAVFESLGRSMAIFEMIQLHAPAAAGTSLARQELAFRENAQEAQIKVSVINANGLIGSVSEPTPEELSASFEEGKARKDAHTDEALQFGYLVPDKVAIEYLTIDPVTLADVVRVREKDAEKFYEDNKQRYQKPVDGPTQPGQRPQMIQMTFDEAKERVREDLRMRKAAEETQSVMNAIRDDLRRPWDAQPADDKGVRPAPPAEKQINFADIVTRFADRGKVTLGRTELLDRDAMRREGGFGRMRAKIGNKPVSAVDAMFLVDGLTRPPGAEGLPALRLNEPGPMLMTMIPGSRNEPYQFFVFRVTQVAPSGPPASIDLVRDTAVKNVKLAKAFAKAGEEAKKLADRARTIGLEAAVAEAAALKEELKKGEEIARATSRPAFMPPIESNYVETFGPTTVDNFKRTPNYYRNVGFSQVLPEKVWPLLDASTASAPSTDPHKIVVVTSPREQTVMVVEAISTKPLYEGDFQAQRNQGDRESQMREQVFVGTWFSAQSIMKRTGYSPVAAANAAKQ